MNKAAPPRSKRSARVRHALPPWPAEMCRRVLESSPWPMFVLDCETGRVLEVNDAAIRKYGFSRPILLASGVEKVVPAEYRPALLAMLAQGLNGPSADYDLEHQLADGRRIPVSVTSFPLDWNGRPARFSMVRSSRVFSSASPAPQPDTAPFPGATAAHDFNNLLTVILAVAEQMQEGQGDPGRQAELIARTVRNAQEMARQRLLLGYQQQSRRERLDLNDAIRSQADVLAAVLGSQIRIEMSLDSELWPVLADGLQWNELLLNLAMNARDAMPSGGLFHLCTRRVFAPGDAYPGLPPGRHIHLAVRDTGIGMAPETRLHAFEPYFSTKPRARNGGLGLASVHGVVHQSGGVIRLTSAPGEGTRFDIFIPAQETAATEAEGALVLLVEDAGELRRLIQDFLITRGYEVISCGSAEAALLSARSLARPLDLLISDRLLPGLTGETLIDQVRQQHPEVRAILMSGQIPGPATGLQQSPTGDPGVVCLQKPFSLHQLAATVEQLLKARGSSAGSQAR